MICLGVFPTSISSIKIRIESHEHKAVFLSGNVLICVVEIKPKLLPHEKQMLDVSN